MSKVERNILKAKDAEAYRNLRGADRLAAERMVMALIRRSATAPQVCGPEVPVAPGRGPCVVVQAVTMVPDGAEGFTAKPGGFAGRSTVRAADIFDLWAARADQGRAVPLSPGQVAIARHYRDLVERRAAGGLKCSQLDARPGGGGEFMDAYLAAGRELAALHRRIGTGEAMVVRRIRPSARGSRRSMTDRTLVDMVCLQNCSLDDVLRTHGWSTFGDTRKAVREALSAALDRMIGFRDEKRS